jgi:NodT family efflux transporter outer membrane factor (OMF) lipoprotein
LKPKLNRKLIKIAAAGALLIPLLWAEGVRAAEVERVDPEAWNTVLRKYEKSAASENVPPPPVTDDEAISAGDWGALVHKYDNKYAWGASEGQELSYETLKEWFLRMDSKTMTSLIFKALESNRDLAAARARVYEARAALGISRASTLPWLDNSDSWTYNQSSDNSASNGTLSKITKLGIDASWEIDIFGGQRLKTEAAEAALESSYASMYSAWVTLSSEVALNYISFCTLRERLSIAERNLALQEETLSLLTSQYEAGLKDSLAMNQAQYTSEQTKASIPPLRTSMENILNTLAILTGTVPGSLEDMISSRQDQPKLFEADDFTGIPANVIRQRPDVRAAERALAAQIALRKSAEKDLLPKFSLVGTIGLETLSGTFFSGDSIGFSFGPRISLPIFHGGAIRKNIQAQTAREEQLLAAYEGTVLTAVAEVRNALVANTQEAERNKSLRAGIEATRSALEVADDKYKNGLTDFNNVINAQVALLSLEDALVVSNGQMTSNVIRIFKALGGGWGPMEKENQENRKNKTS